MITPTSRFAWVSRDILPEATVDALRRRFPALSVRTEDKRLYPMGRAGGSIAGLVGRDQAALGGLETVYDGVLRGRDGEEMLLSDATAPGFQGFERTVLREPEPGADIETTIHARIQEIVLGRMEAGVARAGAAGGLCIVTRPATGEILAMVQVPSADPADPRDLERPQPARASGHRLLRAGLELQARGLRRHRRGRHCSIPRSRSTATAESAPARAASRSPTTSRTACSRPGRCWPTRRTSGSGVLAERAGAERFYRMEKSLGFGEATGIPLPGEGTGPDRRTGAPGPRAR